MEAEQLTGFLFTIMRQKNPQDGEKGRQKERN